MAQQGVFNQRFKSPQYIAQGSFGVIASVTSPSSKEERAIKLIENNDRYVMNEINLLCRPEYHHENIINYYGSWIVKIEFLNPEWKNVLKKKYQKRIPRMGMTAIELELCKGN